MSSEISIRANGLTTRPAGSFIEEISRVDNYTPRLDSYYPAIQPASVYSPRVGTVVPSIVDNGVIMLQYVPQVVTDAIKYRIYVFDKTDKLQTIITQAMQFDFVDVVNGGSARGSFTMKKRFIDTNWFNYDYRVQVYLQDSIDPWYDGFISEFDPQSQDTDSEDITIYTDGWQTYLDRAIVSEILSPGVQPNGVNNGDYYADAYLLHLITTYMDSSKFDPAFVSSIPVYLDQLNFTGEGLGKCIDTVVKQVSDNTGNIFEWWVRGVLGAKPRIVIQPQSNPNKVTQTYITPTRTVPAKFQTEIPDDTVYNYKVQNSAANVFNLIALYGGNDPLTGQQIYSPYKDSTSISLYGPRQKRVTNNNLLSQQSLDNYGTVWLLNNAYPQPQGTFMKFVATDYARAGQWFQLLMKGLSNTGESFVQSDGSTVLPSLPQKYSQYRCIQVELALQNSNGDRIEQTISLQAPRPFADGATYNAIINSRIEQAALASRQSFAQVKTYFMQQGFEWVS